MKKGVKEEIITGIKKKLILLGIFILIVLLGVFVFNKITGRVVADTSSGGGFGGPSSSDVSCMMTCMGCSSPGVGCTGDSATCQAQCNVEKPESTSETSCMEKCVLVGCGEFDFDCQNKNKETCEKDCDMLGDKPDESEMSAEQLCITNCVESIDASIRCGNSQTGETGGSVCQKCAVDCVHLYEGPCLDDEKLSVKKKECETCEHCYGEPIMGDSGEGWECITDVKCGDASAEFGDEPGIGPGVEQEGFVANVGEAVGNFFEGIGNFFGNLFGGEESTSEADAQASSK